MGGIPFYKKDERRTALRTFVLAMLIVFIIQGLLILGLSTWMVGTRITPCHFTADFYVEGYVSLTAAGILVLVCLAGNVTTLKGTNTNYTRKFFAIVLVVMILDVISVTFSYVHKYDVKNGAMLRDMNASLWDYPQSPAAQMCWDALQSGFHCCGVTNASDWLLLGDKLDDVFPPSCECTQSSKKGGKQHECVAVGTKNLYRLPCYPVYKDEILVHMDIIQLLLPIVLTMQIGHILFTYCMAFKVQNHSVVDIYIVSSTTL